MTREEIIRMAREKFACQYSKLPIAEFRIEDFFQAAYAAGAAAEREACAQVCEEHWEIDGTRTAKEFAAAIRARGQA